MEKDEVIPKGWVKEYKTKGGRSKFDFKGLYVFLHEEKPFYVGISKGVIGRMIQHVKGKSHYTSTLAFMIGKKHYELREGKEFNDGRKKLVFETDVEPIKDFLLKQKVAFINIENDDELALFEIYCSLQFGTYLNTFKTH